MPPGPAARAVSAQQSGGPGITGRLGPGGVAVRVSPRASESESGPQETRASPSRLSGCVRFTGPQPLKYLRVREPSGAHAVPEGPRAAGPGRSVSMAARAAALVHGPHHGDPRRHYGDFGGPSSPCHGRAWRTDLGRPGARPRGPPSAKSLRPRCPFSLSLSLSLSLLSRAMRPVGRARGPATDA